MSKTSDEIRAITSRWVASPMKSGIANTAEAFEAFERNMDGIDRHLEEIKGEIASFDKKLVDAAKQRQEKMRERFGAIEKDHDEISRRLAQLCREDDEYQKTAYRPPAELLAGYNENEKYEVHDQDINEKLKILKKILKEKQK